MLTASSRCDGRAVCGLPVPPDKSKTATLRRLYGWFGRNGDLGRGDLGATGEQPPQRHDEHRAEVVLVPAMVFDKPSVEHFLRRPERHALGQADVLGW
jgi:hypothetical protein